MIISGHIYPWNLINYMLKIRALVRIDSIFQANSFHSPHEGKPFRISQTFSTNMYFKHHILIPYGKIRDN